MSIEKSDKIFISVHIRRLPYADDYAIVASIDMQKCTNIDRKM